VSTDPKPTHLSDTLATCFFGKIAHLNRSIVQNTKRVLFTRLANTKKSRHVDVLKTSIYGGATYKFREGKLRLKLKVACAAIPSSRINSFDAATAQRSRIIRSFPSISQSSRLWMKNCRQHHSRRHLISCCVAAVVVSMLARLAAPLRRRQC
jgi:hypothetical protein